MKLNNRPEAARPSSMEVQDNVDDGHHVTSDDNWNESAEETVWDFYDFQADDH